MCAWGDTVDVDVEVAAVVSSTGIAYRARKAIDRCIAPIVEALDRGGVRMHGSCCGHGKGPGEILLADGRKLVIS